MYQKVIHLKIAPMIIGGKDGLSFSIQACIEVLFEHFMRKNYRYFPFV
jgi:hypothetical protein